MWIFTANGITENGIGLADGYAYKTLFNRVWSEQADGIREIKSGLAHRNILSGSARLAARTGREMCGAGLSFGT